MMLNLTGWYIKKVLVIGIILQFTTGILGCTNVNPGSETDSYSWVDKNSLVAHAFGGINGKTYSNSLEAFEANYAKGHRVFEVDFALTSDGHLVARHDWGKLLSDMLMQEIPAGKEGKPLTLEEFMSLKIYKKYTPLSWEDIIQLMVKYKDIYLITDTKETKTELVRQQFQILVNSALKIDPKILDRVIPQIYNEEMLETIKEVYNFKSIIYTLYQTNSSDDEVLDFALKNKVRVITMARSRYSKPFVNKLAENRIYVYVHTVNDQDETKKYFNNGVKGVYTDFIAPADLVQKR